jgi:hypothetical protein
MGINDMEGVICKVRDSLVDIHGEKKANDLLDRLRLRCKKRIKTLISLELNQPLKNPYEAEDAVVFETRRSFEVEVTPKVTWVREADLQIQAILRDVVGSDEDSLPYEDLVRMMRYWLRKEGEVGLERFSAANGTSFGRCALNYHVEKWVQRSHFFVYQDDYAKQADVSVESSLSASLSLEGDKAVFKFVANIQPVFTS